MKKNSVLNQDLESILEISLNHLDPEKGGYKGAPKFPTFYLFETLLYFHNTTQNSKYLRPVSLILKQLCSKGIYDHVEGGISRYTVDENWLVPHFEKMLYDNVQFILLLSKYCKIDNQKYFKEKLEQTIEFLRVEFLNKDKLLGSAYDADGEGEEGKYYVYKFEEIKDIDKISEYFDVSPSGNWENKNILVEKNKPPKEILDKLYQIRKRRKKPLFDNKSQLDLNCLWISSLIAANDILPENI